MLFAIATGLLTFIFTPLVFLAVAVVFAGVHLFWPDLYPGMIIARIFNLQEMGGYFVSQLALFAVMGLAGDVLAALITWHRTRARQLALLTFVAAVVFQLVGVGVAQRDAATYGRKLETQRAEEKSRALPARLGAVTFEVADPIDVAEVNFKHTDWGQRYQKLVLLVPVTVVKPGLYQVTAKYDFEIEGLWCNTDNKSVDQRLEAGEQIVRIEFQGNEAHGSYGFWSPAKAGGSVVVKLSALVSEKEILDGAKVEGEFERRAMAQFKKDEGLDQREPGTKADRNKFIEEKTIRF